MKAIINGLRFDTAKARHVGWASASCPRTDFSYWEADLYRTPRSGRYFLAGSGGPMTRWARKVDGGSRSGGSGIQQLDLDEARDWAEQYLTADQIEAGFAIEEA